MDREWLTVRYVCGECGYDAITTVPQAAEHWRTCLLPKIEERDRD